MMRLTQHAEEAIRARGIRLNWVESAVRSPDRVWVDPTRPDRMHSYKAISAFGMRILHVVHRPDHLGVVVITAYFDRSAKP